MMLSKKSACSPALSCQNSSLERLYYENPKNKCYVTRACRGNKPRPHSGIAQRVPDHGRQYSRLHHLGLNPDMSPQNAIDGTGLAGGVPSLTGSHGQSFDTNWWSGWDGAVTDWQLTVNLEDSYDLEVMHVWNYRESCCPGRGLNEVEIFVSPDGDEANLVKLITDGTGIHDSGGNFVFPQASTDPDYFGFDLDLSGVTNPSLLTDARLVRIDGGSSLHGGGEIHGGLAEIQFGSRAIPEPASATLGLLGIVGLMMRRRNA
jgi:hypothetical protein